MGKLVYGMNVSLDGYVASPGGDLEWAAVDEEVHTYWNNQGQGEGVSVYGRRLWEVMRYWQTALDDPDLPEVMVEFARTWLATPKIVFSSTLESVEGNARLVRGDAVAEVARLKAEMPGEIGVGGPTLAASLIRAGLVDEYRVVVHPVLLGGGLPLFPSLDRPLDLELVETRRFGGGAMLLVYRPKTA